MAVTAGFTGRAGKPAAGSASLAVAFGSGIVGRPAVPESLATLSFPETSATTAGRSAVALAASSFCGTPNSRIIAARIIRTSVLRTWDSGFRFVLADPESNPVPIRNTWTLLSFGAVGTGLSVTFPVVPRRRLSVWPPPNWGTTSFGAVLYENLFSFTALPCRRLLLSLASLVAGFGPVRPRPTPFAIISAPAALSPPRDGSSGTFRSQARSHHAAASSAAASFHRHRRPTSRRQIHTRPYPRRASPRPPHFRLRRQSFPRRLLPRQTRSRLSHPDVLPS